MTDYDNIALPSVPLPKAGDRRFVYDREGLLYVDELQGDGTFKRLWTRYA